ncbi:amidoligase family protein [Rhodovulum euryhalinum]|uniref:Putative amidoligase enzyme n=1 Tax=Rhodovulum euryhalinum TaxID=35805 RepID=A0A4R2KNT0_9RHOB|nr:amidoligase family protein [Rhodovulum euryhalinum]TCO72486.1 putative amidoligase enzyme [Rhodovulum euryhalinum]
MDSLAALVPRDRFLPLCPETNAGGAPRRAGIEIEFGGLTEAEAARVVADALGGRVHEKTAHELVVEGTDWGAVEVCLDTIWREKAGGKLADLGLDLSRAVVPVEIVTPPLAPGHLPALDRLRGALREAGAQGSRDGLLLGFGLHLNPEVAAETLDTILPVARAFALIEDWLRKADPIDPARRVLPFVDPWPRRLVDRLAGEAAGWDLAAFIDAYLAETPTRNRGLDLLPLFRHLDADRVGGVLEGAGGLVSARPTFHYRLPDCRIDEPGWRIAYDWNRWVMVERLAADTAALDRLASDWLAYRGALTTMRGDWFAHLEERLDALALWETR